MPRTTASLFDVLGFLCANVYNIKLLSKGVTFENGKYITLWSAVDDRENHITEIIQNLGLPADFEGGLVALSEIICIFVMQELLGEGRYNENLNEKLNSSHRIEDMKITYKDIDKQSVLQLHSGQNKFYVLAVGFSSEGIH